MFCELLFDCGVDRGGEMSLPWLFFFYWEERLLSLEVYFFVLAKNLDMLFVLRGELFYLLKERGKFASSWLYCSLRWGKSVVFVGFVRWLESTEVVRKVLGVLLAGFVGYVLLSCFFLYCFGEELSSWWFKRVIGFGKVIVKGFFSILENGERWSVAVLTSSLFGRERIDHPVFFYFFLSFFGYFSIFFDLICFF